MMTAVRSLDVCLLATLVVAFALVAAVEVLIMMCVAIKRNNRVAAYPHKIHSQHCCYFDCS